MINHKLVRSVRTMQTRLQGDVFPLLCASICFLLLYSLTPLPAQSPGGEGNKTRGGAQESEAFVRPCPEHLDLRLTVRPVSAADVNDGAISIEVLGSVGELTYSWRGPDHYAESQNLLNLKPGDYELIVRDERGCDLTRKITVSRRDAEPALATPGELLASPNPSDGEVSIFYEVRREERIWIEVFDQFGTTVAIPVDASHSAGSYCTDLRLNKQAAGVY